MKVGEDEEEEAGNAEKMPSTVLLTGEPSKADVLELPGFRFHPTDEELVGFYLRRRVEKKPLRMEIIKQMDIYKHEPWDLPVNIEGGEERYFFCQRGRKYRNSIRPNRVTASGFWKATGIDRPIYSSVGKLIGLKKSLVYYVGNAGKGTKTDWMMHEFRHPPKGSGKNDDDLANDACLQEAEVWTICRIFKRNVASKKYTQALKQASTSENHIHESPSISCSMDSGIDYEHKQSAAPRNQFEQLHCNVNLPNHDANYPSASDLGCSFACQSKVEDLIWEELRELMDL